MNEIEKLDTLIKGKPLIEVFDDSLFTDVDVQNLENLLKAAGYKRRKK